MQREDDASGNSANADIGALKERIARLEKENGSLKSAASDDEPRSRRVRQAINGLGSSAP